MSYASMWRHWKARALACKPPCVGGQSVCAVGLQGFTDSDKFDPDRFSPERKEDVKFAKNYLVFGHGPHYCVGKEYAVNQLTCYLAILATR